MHVLSFNKKLLHEKLIYTHLLLIKPKTVSGKPPWKKASHKELGLGRLGLGIGLGLGGGGCFRGDLFLEPPKLLENSLIFV